MKHIDTIQEICEGRLNVITDLEKIFKSNPNNETATVLLDLWINYRDEFMDSNKKENNPSILIINQKIRDYCIYLGYSKKRINSTIFGKNNLLSNK